MTTNTEKKIFTLLEVTSSIQKTLASRYSSSFWVKAEMNKMNYYPHSGHCYPELVEKRDGKIIAQLKSNLWKDDFIRINKNFQKVVGAPLKDGIMMLFSARITFDPVHGLSLRIMDIDPVFSLGELEREKQESIAKLKEENLFGRNKTLRFPVLPKRIAIISVQTSKGYADFLKILDGNSWGYKFFHVLFPSLLQGDRAVDSILQQLARIRRVQTCFDVVALIRGGGGDVGLSCFNDYRLAKQIALFPLPVITGIGHATNETVAEMVAFRNAITPSELADFLLQRFHEFSVPLTKAREVIVACSRDLLSSEKEKLFGAVKYFKSVSGNVVTRARHGVQHESIELLRQANIALLRQKHEQSVIIRSVMQNSFKICRERASLVLHTGETMSRIIAQFIRTQKSEISTLSRAVGNLHPRNVLRRGYSITRINGMAVDSAAKLSPDDQIETELFDGRVVSKVVTLKMNQHE